MSPTAFDEKRRNQLRAILFCIVGGVVNVTAAYTATFPVMITPMLPSFGGSRTVVTLGYSAVLASMALAGPLVGRLVDRFGLRQVIFAGTTGLSVALASFYLVPTTPLFYLGICVAIGFFGAATFQFFYYSLLPYWFDRGLGVALGVSAAGTAFGLAFAPQFADLLVRHVGWQLAYVVLGAIVLTVGLPNLLLLKAPARNASTIAGVPSLEGMDMSAVIRTTAFWKLVVCYFLLCAMINANVVHLVALLTDHGVSAISAARSMVFLGAANFIGRLLSGLLLTQFKASHVGGALFLAGTAGAALLTFASAPAWVAASVILMGLALGVEGEMLNFMARHVFGLRAQGAILGALATAFLAGVMVGPLLLSGYRDVSGSYLAMQWILIGAGTAAGILHLSIRTRAPARAVRARQADVCPEVG